MIKKKGFTLLEVTIVLGIGTLIAFMKFQDMRNDQEAVLADNVGTQIKQLGEAVNRYISIRYDKISTLSSSNNQSSDPGPRTCSAAGCEITYQTLINEGLLPVGLKWFTEFGHLNRGDMLTSEQHRCHNEKKKFQRRV